MISKFEKLGGTYHDQNGYLLLNLIVPESPRVDKWGRRYLHYLKTKKRARHTALIFSNKLHRTLKRSTVTPKK